MDDNLNNIDRIINGALSPRGWINTLSLSQFFKVKIDEMDISKNQALKIMDIETKSFDAFMLGESTKIDYLTILKISKFLEISPTVFIDKFLLKIGEENKQELERIKINHFIAKNFDLETLRKNGFINSVNDFDDIEKKILNFFGYETVFQYKSNIDIPVYSSGKITSNIKSQKFWVNMAYATFDKIYNSNEYDRDYLVKLFPSLRAYSINVESGLSQVCKLLFKAGITVIFIPKIYDNLHIRAATFCINDKPCIAITNYKDYYPTLWFSLFHELYHVLYDWEEILISESNAHISAGMSTATVNEDAANEFASRYLFDEDKLKEIEPFINNPSYIAKYARGYNIHESIVYAIYAYKFSTPKNKLFGKFRHFLITPGPAIESFNPSDYENYVPIPKIARTTKLLID